MTDDDSDEDDWAPVFTDAYMSDGPDHSSNGRGLNGLRQTFVLVMRLLLEKTFHLVSLPGRSIGTQNYGSELLFFFFFVVFLIWGP